MTGFQLHAFIATKNNSLKATKTTITYQSGTLGHSLVIKPLIKFGMSLINSQFFGG